MFIPFEKSAPQIGSFPRGFGWKQKILETTTHLRYDWSTPHSKKEPVGTSDVHPQLEKNNIFQTFYTPEVNIAPEKWWLEAYFPIGKVTFQGLC